MTDQVARKPCTPAGFCGIEPNSCQLRDEFPETLAGGCRHTQLLVHAVQEIRHVRILHERRTVADHVLHAFLGGFEAILGQQEFVNPESQVCSAFEMEIPPRVFKGSLLVEDAAGVVVGTPRLPSKLGLKRVPFLA